MRVFGGPWTAPPGAGAVAAAVLGGGLVRPGVHRRRRDRSGRPAGRGDDRGAAGLARLSQVLHRRLVAVVLTVVIALLRPANRGRAMRVPLGPALVAATLLVC